MNLELTQEQELIRHSLARFLDEHSSMARVRATAPTGFDPALWRGLADLGVFSLRLPAAGGGLGTFEAILVMEQVGRTLASGPIAEAILAARLIEDLAGADHQDLLGRIIAGAVVVTLAYHDVADQPQQWITAGEYADYIIARNGDEVVLILPTQRDRGEPNLASNGLAEIDLSLQKHQALGTGPNAVRVFEQALEEWKLLMAAALAALSRQAIEMAAAYAGERRAFGQFIGTYQAISHPLAVLITDTDASRYFTWKTVVDIAEVKPTASAQVSLTLWWAEHTASRSVSQAIQTFGGYGLTTDYDIHLYALRAKAWVLAFGDPESLLEEGASRLYASKLCQLPEVGSVTIDFDRGDEAKLLASEMCTFFRSHLTQELRSKADFTWEGYDPGIHRELAKAKLLFPDWPRELGGREASAYAATSAREACEAEGWSVVAAAVARMVGSMIHRFGSDQLKRDVLSHLASGEAVCSLGWSEPGAGSDVFAAQTRATRDGDSWLINGQKMFTSGAQIADYVYLIARTNPDVPKHKGITMFIVPLNSPGITVKRVDSFQDEPTNITFYDDVRVPDCYRLGDVDGGLAVMAATLEIEHSASYAHLLGRMLAAGEQLCREISRKGSSLIEHASTQRRLARLFTQYQLAQVLNERMLWAAVEKKSVPACGPMARLQSAEAFYEGARELLDLTAPMSLSKRTGAAAFINRCYRHAHAARIYGGSQEIQRSQIAERHLGLPRTRS